MASLLPPALPPLVSANFSLCLSLSLSHPQSCILSHTHPHSCILSHTLTHTRILSHILTHFRILSDTLAYSHLLLYRSHSLVLSPFPPPSLCFSLSHSHAPLYPFLSTPPVHSHTSTHAPPHHVRAQLPTPRPEDACCLPSQPSPRLRWPQ